MIILSESKVPNCLKAVCTHLDMTQSFIQLHQELITKKKLKTALTSLRRDRRHTSAGNGKPESDSKTVYTDI